MLFAGGLDAVDGALNTAVHAVFESDRHLEAAGKFSVDLRFCGARADCPIGDGVFDVGSKHGIQEFSGAGQTDFVEPDEEASGDLQADVRLAGAVEFGIVEKAFPSDDAARFFEVGPHHEKEFVFYFPREFSQSGPVFDGAVDVVNRAGAADYYETFVVFSGENAANGAAGCLNVRSTGEGERRFGSELNGGG